MLGAHDVGEGDLESQAFGLTVFPPMESSSFPSNDPGLVVLFTQWRAPTSPESSVESLMILFRRLGATARCIRPVCLTLASLVRA